MNKKFLTAIALSLFFFSSSLSEAFAVNFEKLSCDPIPSTGSATYNVQVKCRAQLHRPGTAQWNNVVGQDCNSFCRSVGGYNVPSPEGFSCVSGEARPLSAIGKIDFSPTGCWHDCAQPEGLPGAVSIDGRCYSPGQRRDNDRTDTTLGCFCATGDTGATTIQVGIHASGSARINGISATPQNWQRVDSISRNEAYTRIFNIYGEIPLAQSGTIDMTVNVQGACGTKVQMTGIIAHIYNVNVRSETIDINIPTCAASVPQCSDGIDNDADGAVDYPADFGCDSATDTDESNPKSQCQNGIDDDGDGLTDYPNDPGCASKQDNREGDGTSQCQDGIDNDGDGATDYPADFGCDSRQDNNEGDRKASCQDGIDNDSDGLTDYPTDPGCSSGQDNNEGDGTSQCQDGLDNDGDGAFDYPADISCDSPQDNNEGDRRAACQDGIDNDGDALIDYPSDPGCANAQDGDETNAPTPRTLKVTPIAECVDVKQDGTLVGHFGYKNEGTTDATIPVGLQNAFSPGQQDRGQPTTFVTGRVTNAFTVTFPSTSTLRWTLGDSFIEASIQTTQCQGQNFNCIETNIKNTLILLDGTARRQKMNVVALANRILALNPSDETAAIAQSYIEQAEALYLQQWQGIWSGFPQVSLSCEGCLSIDKASNISALNLGDRRLLRLNRRAILTLKEARGGKLRPSDYELLHAGTELDDLFTETLQDLPRFESQCN